MKLYIQRKQGFDFESQNLTNKLKELLRLPHLNRIEIILYYHIEGVSQDVFNQSKSIIFSQVQSDEVFEDMTFTDCDDYFILQPLEGQFDQRADSAIQCLQILNPQSKPKVKTAKIFKLFGDTTRKKEVIRFLNNPLESREISLDELHYPNLQSPLACNEEIIIHHFLEMQDFQPLIQAYQLTLDPQDLQLIQSYFRHEQRNPNLLELKIIDTYWSDHCRHTTFFTHFDQISSDDPLAEEIFQSYLQIRQNLKHTKPICLMDLATLASKNLKAQQKLASWEETEENNACTLNVKVKTDQGLQDWLLFFKNETHNHPTEIEPFGGASTCIGGAIRDPLSARGYVHCAMRISGSANPLEALEDTREGKLPQRTIALSSSEGYSSYGNQIGVATGMIEEFYHQGYKAKHLELGVVLGAVKKQDVIIQTPKEGDCIMLVGGRTGRDGCGGATGSSQAHHLNSLVLCGEEVQKGNAPEERKLQRFFRSPEATRLIKRCNDFGAGGVSVAISELADGVEIDLDKILCKYDNMSVNDLVFSESQERMAIVIDPQNQSTIQALAEKENLECTLIARVTNDSHIIMKYQGQKVAQISKTFLQKNGVPKHVNVSIAKPQDFSLPQVKDFTQGYHDLLSNLNLCSKKGLIEKFDSTIGGYTIFMPLGGKYQETPIQAMAHKFPLESGESTTCSIASFGFNPFICEKDPCKGAYLAVIESVCKLIASGAEFKEIYLSFQEYFERLGNDKNKWGKPVSALLGAFLAQQRLGICAIGGKDSMSGSFEDLNVPPTFISFAFSASDSTHLISPEFKSPNHKVYWIKPQLDAYGLPIGLEENFHAIHRLIKNRHIISAYTPTMGGVAEAVMKMCLGNRIGFAFNPQLSLEEIFGYTYGSFIVESVTELDIGIELGKTLNESQLIYKSQSLPLLELLEPYELALESVYKTQMPHSQKCPPLPHSAPQLAPIATLKHFKPRVLIPVFFGTNCEYETKRAFERVGAEVEILVIQNLTSQHIFDSIHAMQKSLKQCQILFLCGGFSGGDEPDGSAKLIKTFFHNLVIKESIHSLLDKQDGLIGGICNGFQALVKLGLVPFGKIMHSQANHPILLHNTIQRHQSKIVQIKICSNFSPWLSQTQIGEIYSVAISHGEGRFYANQNTIEELAQKGQIATQYVDFEGNATMDITFNPNGSSYAIEGITSEDGRIFGKMGHTERIGAGLYKNIIGNFDMKIFEGAVAYFK